jgi:hypothetical protein
MDRFSKLLLILIAAGLWSNTAASFVKAGVAAEHSVSLLANIESALDRIERGICSNQKICGKPETPRQTSNGG